MAVSQSFRQDGSRLIWETDPVSATQSARINTRLGWGLIIAGILLWVLLPVAWVGSLVLGFFALACLKQSWGASKQRSRVVIDGDTGKITQERWSVGEEPVQTGHWPLVNFSSVAVAWRCAMSVSRTNMEGTVQINDVVVRLVGPIGGMTLDRFRHSEAEAAKQRADLIAEVVKKPIIHQSIRADGFLFQFTPIETTMGATFNPDRSNYVRELAADEIDNSNDRVVERSRWHALDEPADLLALPDTWFFF